MAPLPSRIGKRVQLHNETVFGVLKTSRIFSTFTVTELGLGNYHFLISAILKLPLARAVHTYLPNNKEIETQFAAN